MPEGPLVEVPLIALAYGRSGDKGDSANIGILARRPEFLGAIDASLTADAVKQYFAHIVTGKVERFALPGLHGFNFVLHRGARRRRRRLAAPRPARQGVRADAARCTDQGAGGLARTARPACGFRSEGRARIVTQAILALANVQVFYDRAIEALRDISLDITEGAIVALLGSNGAGKSTVLKAISGVLDREDGEIRGGSVMLDGEDISHLSAERIVSRGLVQVPEGRALFATLTVEENLLMGGYTRDRAEVRDGLAGVYELFPRVKERRHQISGYLSGGEQQMVAIGRALMAKPRILMLDEPSLGLAPQIVEGIFDTVTRLNREHKLTVLLVEQNAQLALSVASYGYIMENGRIVLDGPSARLQGQSRRAGVLSRLRRSRRAQEHARRETLQAPQAVAVMTALLTLENLSKNFGGIKAVSDISFSVEQGSICSLIGPNGAGKTTVFNLISAILPPSGGRVLFDGADITRLPTYALARLGIARTFQNLAVFKHETVVNNLLVGMHTHLKADPFSAAVFFGRARREEIAARERAEEIIEFLEIEDIRDQPVGTLSYGLQKRVELGRALAIKPRLLLLDEMVSGMNQEEREDIARFILDLKDELGLTVLMVEHDMGIVMDISDHVCVMNHGAKIAEGTPAEVSANPAVIDAYLGARRAA